MIVPLQTKLEIIRGHRLKLERVALYFEKLEEQELFLFQYELTFVDGVELSFYKVEEDLWLDVY